MQDTAADVGMRHGGKRRAAEASRRVRCGQRPGGRSFAPGEEVGSGCIGGELRRGATMENATDGGGGRIGGNEKIHKIGGERWGRRFRRICVISNRE